MHWASAHAASFTKGRHLHLYLSQNDVPWHAASSIWRQAGSAGAPCVLYVSRLRVWRVQGKVTMPATDVYRRAYMDTLQGACILGGLMVIGWALLSFVILAG